MIGIAALTLLTTVGAGFYIRFLVALCKEARLFTISYLVRLETGPDELQVIEQPEADDSAAMAA
jgi:hypothetical protein